MKDDTPIADLTARLRAVNSRLRRRLREQGNVGDLTTSQVAALNRLEREGPLTVSALARTEGLRPQSMGTIIAALVAAGLVSGSPDASDGRQTLFTLTPVCIERLTAGRTAHQDWLSARISRLAPDELHALTTAVGLLEHLCAN